MPLYKEVLQSLVDAGAEYIQIDEPALVTDDSVDYEDITKTAYNYFSEANLGDYLVVQTYFERVNLSFLNSLPIRGIGLDFVHDHGFNLKQIEDGQFDRTKTLYAGIIDGRNVWAADIEAKKSLSKHYKIIQMTLSFNLHLHYYTFQYHLMMKHLILLLQKD